MVIFFLAEDGNSLVFMKRGNGDFVIVIWPAWLSGRACHSYMVSDHAQRHDKVISSILIVGIHFCRLIHLICI